MSWWDWNKYKCDQCGACCVHFMIPVNQDDVRREPRLSLHLVEVQGDDRKFLNNSNDPCPLLTDIALCSVYPTRPGCCSRFEPGSAKCQWARGRAGLGTLQPV